MRVKLVTKEIERKMPELYSTEEIPTDDKILAVKFFAPWSNWTWYAVEFDAVDGVFFGYVEGHCGEWGAFSLAELESVRGPFGLKVERDRHWNPVKFSELNRAA